MQGFPTLWASILPTVRHLPSFRCCGGALPQLCWMVPCTDLCVPFYKKVRELDMVLLSHTGKEHSVDGESIICSVNHDFVSHPCSFVLVVE